MSASALALDTPDTKRSRIEQAFVDACLLDVTALKPGNVGVHAGGHRMQAIDFVRSARAAAPAVADDGAGVGERILRAVSATQAVAAMNTNLGIVLLAAPIAAAAQRVQGPLSHAGLSAALEGVLAALTVADAASAFEAIRLARPGGLGDAARHDVREPARATLLESMREAADRDSIARQYATAYADVIQIGLARLASCPGIGRRRAATEVFLGFLSRLPDSHVARKFGAAQAEALRDEACMRIEARRAIARRLGAACSFAGMGRRLEGARSQSGYERRSHGRHFVLSFLLESD